MECVYSTPQPPCLSLEKPADSHLIRLGVFRQHHLELDRRLRPGAGSGAARAVDQGQVNNARHVIG